MRLHHEIQGEGPPLVLIHGWTHDLRVWELQTPALSSRFTVVRYDRRGWGRSEGSPDVSHDAADLDALLDDLGLGSVHVLGHSQGARAALSFALEHGERVRSLVLVGTPPLADLGVPWVGPDAMDVDVFALAREEGLEAVEEVFFNHPMARGFEKGGRGAELMAELWYTNAERALADPVSQAGSEPPPSMQDLPGLEMPTLVLTGELELPFFQIVSDSVAYALPDAERRRVEGGGHAIHTQEPERFNAEVLRFLRRLDEGGRR